jgi:hypothetical protein
MTEGGKQVERDEEERDPTECVRCGNHYSLRDGCDPGKYCDPCAQERVIELESAASPPEAARAWISGATFGWNCGQENAEEKFQAALRSGYQNIREAGAERVGPCGEHHPTKP